MYGILLRLDAGRQQRVGTDVLKRILSPSAYKALSQRPRALNSSLSDTMPFAPTLMRPAMYPERFRVTELRTLFWKLKNMKGLHSLAAVTFEDPEHIVFKFSDKAAEKELTEALCLCGHCELINPQISGKEVSYELAPEGYSIEEDN